MPEIAFSAQSNMKDAAKAMRLILTMALSCGISVWLGSFLDECFHTSPWILLCLLAYAIISSVYLMVKKLGSES